jgi:serine/threonine protein kinase
MLEHKLLEKSQMFLLLGLQIRNEKSKRYLSAMRKKQPIPFSEKFPSADPSALKLLQRLLAFDPKDRPTAEEVGVLMRHKYLHCFCSSYFKESYANR